GNDFTGFRVDQILGQHATQDEVFGHGNALDLGVGQVAQVLGVDALVFFDNDGTRAVGNVEMRDFALPALGHELEHAAFFQDFEVIEIREVGQNGFGRHADGLEQDGHGH